MDTNELIESASVIASGMLPTILEAANLQPDRIDHVASLSVQIAIAIERHARKKIMGS
jgi:hypothetical protein